jgi:hypothetical protein
VPGRKKSNMQHAVIDTSIFHRDRKRNKAAFRALERLLRGHMVQLHLPFWVKQEFLSQQVADLTERRERISTDTNAILRLSDDKGLAAFAQSTLKNTKEYQTDVAVLATAEFEGWLRATNSIEHDVAPTHGQRVTDAYFAGTPPFTKAKQREDLPDNFIWQTILDLTESYGKLHVIANDGALYKAAKDCRNIIAYKTLEDFIQTQECQQALKGLSDQAVAANVDRASELLRATSANLKGVFVSDLPSALDGKDVHSRRIPDDNNEGVIIEVGEPEDVTFDFDAVEYYGASELGVPFETSVECTLNYAIFIADYYTLSDDEQARISISERNEHYFDADEEYTVKVSGTLSIKIDARELEREDLQDEDLTELIADAEYTIEIVEVIIPRSDGIL